ncbi:nucleotidyltransferase domain-containing protein [Candidatus Marsarchaeota archaeon]|nr:nucleotidyltransferase domain-containing protein [Candidatus Marsarchaeota archaeon]
MEYKNNRILYNYLINDAKNRKKEFDNLDTLLIKLKNCVREIDKDSKVYVFGSVLGNNWSYRSDIDILIITNIDGIRQKMLEKLYKKGFKYAFEFHIATEKEAEFFNKEKMKEI